MKGCIMFDPWTATIEEAIEESERRHNPNSLNPIFQQVAATEINLKRAEIEAGDGFSVLACIRDCVTFGLVAPDWLARAFNMRYDAVLNCRAKSWDDPKSFGSPYPKGTNINALRKKRRFKTAIWNDIRSIRQQDPNRPIDESLFEEVGKKYGIGKTLAAEYYYEVKRYMGF